MPVALNLAVPRSAPGTPMLFPINASVADSDGSVGGTGRAGMSVGPHSVAWSFDDGRGFHPSIFQLNLSRIRH